MSLVFNALRQGEAPTTARAVVRAPTTSRSSTRILWLLPLIGGLGVAIGHLATRLDATVASYPLINAQVVAPIPVAMSAPQTAPVASPATELAVESRDSSESTESALSMPVEPTDPIPSVATSPDSEPPALTSEPQTAAPAATQSAAVVPDPTPAATWQVSLTPDPALRSMRQITAELNQRVQQGDFVRATQLLHQAEALLGTDNLAVLRLRAYVHLQQGQLHQAYRDYQRVLRYQTLDLEANLNMASIEWRTGRVTQARERVQRLYSRYPDHSTVRQHYHAYR